MVLIDTGVFIAAADRTEPRHVQCADLLRTRPDLTVPAPVIPETAWLLEDRLGPDAEVRFLKLATSGRIKIVDLIRDDYDRSINLIAEYADLGLGFVDASVVVVAERLAISTIATLNHRDFAVVRPSHVSAFELVP